MYDTTKAGAWQDGGSRSQIMPLVIVGSLQAAFPPSAQLEKISGQPVVGHGQLVHLPKTEWQSVRALHAASVVTVEHDEGAGHAAGHSIGGSVVA